MDDGLDFIGDIAGACIGGGGSGGGDMSGCGPIVTFGIIGAIVIGIPVMIFSHNAEKKEKERIAEQKRIEKLNDPRTMSEKAGAAVRDSVVDFGKGVIFGKPEKKEEK